jgi:ribosomal protein S18 acetylase RimI-like enzyme
MNHRYFEKRGMRPLFVEEIAVHPDYHGMGIGSFMFEQIEHAARLRGCTHIVLEVAENNEEALRFYRKRNFHSWRPEAWCRSRGRGVARREAVGRPESNAP